MSYNHICPECGWPVDNPACAAGTCGGQSKADTEPPTYLAPLRVELDRLRAELATATDTLEQRSDALNRTGASNDQLRATLARVEKLADLFDTIADNYDAGSLRYPTNSVTARSVAARIRATLVAQETPSE